MSRIKNIKSEKYTGDVIEFDIEKNHNYLTPMGLCIMVVKGLDPLRFI